MKKTLLTVIICAFTLLAKAQDASVEKSVFGIQTGPIGLWVHNESRLSNKIALRSEVGLDASFWSGYNSTDFILGMVISIEPKWYYNLNKRKDKSKRIDGNSGNFISLKTSFHPDILLASSNDNINLVSDLTIIPTWGIRRNIGNHFNYEAGFGIGYIHYFNYENLNIIGESDVGVNLHLRIGYKF
ncbi:hypothetical protein [Bizionia arctica]|uniref:Outer membrane protein beta-barrel domain-containing protein n=1 Tax=Bizionia arctica TaxID=1495645 RepID=A0A917GWP2_9FLAO|nr:hypothetical protein [Bizionia arctica]GGG59594.1 hypothetical protein GCM10010976_32950 [Bizionia arctica]